MNPTPEYWQRVTVAFDEALAVNGIAREAFLQKLQLEDPLLAKEVVSLLGFHDTADPGFLEDPIGPKIAQALVEKETPSFREGDAVGDFRILSLLGAGSFAKVYLAHQVSLGRQVALKVSSNVGHEAQTMAHLEHDNIVSVFSQSVDEKAGLRMICMQYVPGCTLEKVLEIARQENIHLTGQALLQIVDRCSTVPAIFNPAALKDREVLSQLDAVSAAIWLGIRLGDALEYAHKKGVLHLDIKPGNILLTPYGRPLLTDFNVSINQQAGQTTEPQMLGGTLTFMSPEHLRAFQQSSEEFSAIDERADVYSMGVMLKQLIAASQVTKEESEAVDRVLDTATAASVDVRFRTASRLSRALAGCLELREMSAALPKASRLIRAAQQHPMWVVAGMILLSIGRERRKYRL